MGNVIYISFGTKKGYVRYFWLYRIVSFYPYIILVTIFAIIDFDAPFVPSSRLRHHLTIDNKVGFFMLIYTWITGCIWPYILYGIFRANVIHDGMFWLLYEEESNYRNSTSRDLIGYAMSKRFNEAEQLLKFGIVIQDNYVDDKVKQI